MITPQMVMDKINGFIADKNIDLESLRQEQTKLYADFKSLFNPDALNAVPDDQLLNYLYGQKDENVNSLYSLIVCNSHLIYYAGDSGSWGSHLGAYKKSTTGQWADIFDNIIIEDKALDIAKGVRTLLCAGYDFVVSHDFSDEDMYSELDAELRRVIQEEKLDIRSNYTWLLKFFHIMFPDKFANFHSDEWQMHILRCFGLNASVDADVKTSHRWIRSHRITKFYKDNKLEGVLLKDQIIALYGNPRKFVRIGCSVSKHAHKTSLASSLHENSVVGIGYRDIGELSKFCSDKKLAKGQIKEALGNKYPNIDKPGKDANYLVDFYNTDKDSIYVPMIGQNTLLGFVDNIQEYFYNPELMEDFANFKKGTWHGAFKKDEKFPGSGGGLYVACKEIPDNDYEDLAFLYEKYFYFLDKEPINLNTDSIDTQNTSELDDSEDSNQEEKHRLIGGTNELLYGVPGCGKSYSTKAKMQENGVGENWEKVVFHPDYSYADFVGQILPHTDGVQVTYPFTAGPFTRILKNAIDNPYQNFCLVIEEINRGNAAAIFGDLFQLLDRDEDGTSENSITSPDIAEYVYGNRDEKIYIPSNLYLLATMNTSDQNVFTLDTAFQRRWDMEHIPNNFDDPKHKEHCANKIPNGGNITWGIFAKVINEEIAKNGHDIMGNVDKSLGVYFVKGGKYFGAQKKAGKKFAEKVLKYLWDDALKMDHQAVFSSDCNTLELLLDTFEDKGLKDAFNNDVYQKMLALLPNQDILDNESMDKGIEDVVAEGSTSSDKA